MASRRLRSISIAPLALMSEDAMVPEPLRPSKPMDCGRLIVDLSRKNGMLVQDIVRLKQQFEPCDLYRKLEESV